MAGRPSTESSARSSDTTNSQEKVEAIKMGMGGVEGGKVVVGRRGIFFKKAPARARLSPPNLLSHPPSPHREKNCLFALHHPNIHL